MDKKNVQNWNMKTLLTEKKRLTMLKNYGHNLNDKKIFVIVKFLYFLRKSI